MKNITKITTLCLSLLAIQIAHTASLTSAWEAAKSKAKSGYQSAKQGWENLDESTKNAIIGTGVAAAGTAAVAGAGYAGYKNFDSNKRIVTPNPRTTPASDEEVEQIEQGFLENDPAWNESNYTGK
jgi:hypothetical protein